MTTRADVAAEARRWLKTPHAHQQHTFGVGVDCGCLAGAVMHCLGLVPANWWETDFAPYAGYARTPSRSAMVAICDRFLTPIEIAAAGIGDVLGFRFVRETQHLGIIVPYVHGGHSIIHSSRPARGVVEHILDDVWRARITNAWRMPGVEA